MKTCLIAPIPDLGRYVEDRFAHHLLLDHLFDIPAWGEVYREFYSRRSRAGDFITIDNGAKEHAQGSSLPTLLYRAKQVQANEVVVSDIRFQGRASLDLSSREMYGLMSEWRDLYEEAGKPRLMIVPHGETPIDWSNCLYGLERVAEHVLAEIKGPSYTIGMPYAYDHRFSEGLFPLVELATNHVGQENIHMLGWPRRLESLREISAAFPDIRSIDSSRPIVYAQHGNLISMNPTEYPGRSEHYFTTPTQWEHDPVVGANIQQFRDYAHDR